MSEDEGVWVAFYYGSEHIIPFPSELEARRHAMETSMGVQFVRWGEEP
jgi:hypothetical protein